MLGSRPILPVGLAVSPPASQLGASLHRALASPSDVRPPTAGPSGHSLEQVAWGTSAALSAGLLCTLPTLGPSHPPACVISSAASLLPPTLMGTTEPDTAT